jgi:hypothetical protein
MGVSLGYGMRTHDLIDAFAKLAENEQDAYPHAYIFFGWIPFMKMYVMGSTAVYSQPVERPAILQNLTRPSGFLSTGRIASLSDFAREVEEANPRDERYVSRRPLWGEICT